MTSATPRKSGESFVVEDANGIALAYVYFEDEPTRQALVGSLAPTPRRSRKRSRGR